MLSSCPPLKTVPLCHSDPVVPDRANTTMHVVNAWNAWYLQLLRIEEGYNPPSTWLKGFRSWTWTHISGGRSKSNEQDRNYIQVHQYLEEIIDFITSCFTMQFNSRAAAAARKGFPSGVRQMKQDVLPEDEEECWTHAELLQIAPVIGYSWNHWINITMAGFTNLIREVRG